MDPKSVPKGGPAFPAADLYDADSGERVFVASQGMKLRDYFAAKALQGMLACPVNFVMPGGAKADGAEDYVRLAWSYADAMLKAREA